MEYSSSKLKCINMISKLFSGVVIASVLLCGTVSANDFEDIQKEWINGLLIGKDMSELSENYTAMLKTSSHYQEPKINYLLQYQQAEKSFIRDLHKLLKIAGEFEQQHQTYINQQYKVLEKHHSKLNHWLDQLTSTQVVVKNSAEKKVLENELKEVVNSRWEAINGIAQLPVKSWRGWTRQSLKYLISTINKSSYDVENNEIILRNASLPFASRNLSAPALVFTPEVTPSYANELAAAGVSSDLASDEVVNLSPEIYQLAASLDNDYIKIYNFVRQQIAEQYYSGSMKGAVGTLHAYAGNDVDQAALLMALLRASNIPTRFVQGVIEQPVDQVANGLGLTEANQVLEALNRAGIAHQPIIQGGQITAIQKHYTWVAAYVPYAHYRGSANDLSDPVWIPLAPAIKTVNFEPHELDYYSLGLNDEQIISDYLTGPASSTNLSPLSFWKEQVQQLYNADYEQLLVETQNTTQALSVMPASLPFEVLATTFEGAALPATNIHNLTIKLTHENQVILDVRLALPELAGKRLTLSYLPSTGEDLNIINQAGGMALVPPHLVDLRPVIKLDGMQIEALSAPIRMAASHQMEATLSGPSGSVQVERKLLSGTYMSLVLGIQQDNYPLSSELENSASDETKPIRLIHNLGLNYQKTWNQAEDELAAVMNQVIIRPLPSLLFMSPEYKVYESQGLPILMQVGGVSVDAVTKSVEVINRVGGDSLAWKRLSALQGSWLESQIFDSQWAVDAISADKGIRLQQQAGQTIELITSNNLNIILPTLNHPDYVKQHISDWVNNGHHALIAPQPLQHNEWQGSAWVIWHPESGNSGYFISGGYAGGQSTEALGDWAFNDLAQMLNAPYAEGVNENPMSGRKISKIDSTDQQTGTVNQMLGRPSQVLVTDAQNRPVVNASVRFQMNNTQAQIETETGFASTIDTFTNDNGIAQVNLKLAENIGAGPSVRINPDDANLTFVGLIEMSVAVNSQLGLIGLAEPFKHYALPGAPSQILVNECNWTDGVECNRYGGQQEMRAGNIHVMVADEFNNPVSNVAIQVTAEAPVPQAGVNKAQSHQLHNNQSEGHSNPDYQLYSIQSVTGAQGAVMDSSALTSAESLKLLEAATTNKTGTIMGRCDVETPAKVAANSCYNIDVINVPACAVETDVIYSETGWSTFTVYNGKGYPATRFPISISAPGLEEKIINRYNGFSDGFSSFGPAGLFYTGTNTDGPNGDYFAARPNESASREINAYYLSYSSDGTEGGCDFIQHSIASIENQYTESTTGNAVISIADPLDTWNVEYQMGADAASNHNQVLNEGVVFDGVGLYPGISFNNMGLNLYSKTVTAEVVGRSPEVFVLDDDSRTAVSSRFDIQIAPASYRPLDLTAIFYAENAAIYEYTYKTPNFPVVEAVLPIGISIDPEKQYFIELIFNRGTAHEIVFDKYPLEGLQRNIVSAVSCENNSGLSGACGGRVINSQFESPIKLSTSLDLPNGLMCRNEGFDLELSTAARVTIEAYKIGINGSPDDEPTVIIQDTLFAQGSNNIFATADDLGNHFYRLKIIATAEDNGDQEEVYGSLVSNYDLSNSLPIGHAIVKGVDLADGSMVYSKQDIALQSPGVDLEFVRTYSSQSRHHLGSMGFGWSHNYLSRVMVGGCGQVTVTGADGGSARFQVAGDQFIPMKGYHSSLVLNDDDTFDFYPKGGNRYHYVRMQDKTWWMEYVEDPNGNRLTVELTGRNDAPVIRSVTDSVGRRLLFTYELRDFGIYRHEMLTQVTGPDGISLSFDYDAIGNLIEADREGDTTDEIMAYSGEVSGPSRSLLMSVSDQATGAVRTWNYQNKSFQVPAAIADIPDIASVEVTSITETDAGTTEFDYTSGLGYNAAVNVIQNEQTSTYTLNSYGAATQITSPAGTKLFDWETDTDVLLMSETDENNRIRTFEYDDFGNVKQENIGNLVSFYSYHAPDQFDPPFIKDRIKTHINWRGHVTSYEYDLAGNKKTEELDQITTQYDYDGQGLVKNITDGRGLISILTYDAFGYQKSMRNPAGDTSKASFNLRGHKLTETDPNGHTTTFTYDNSDRVTRKQLGDRVWTYDYQNGGRTRIETDPNNHSTTYHYDTQGRLLETINADEDTFTYVYDLNGNKTSETDFGGHETTFDYDDANRLRVKTAPLGKVTTYTYDNVGNVKSETTLDRVTEYDYDPNRYFQTSITRKSDSGDAVISRTVDGNGNVLTEIDPNQNETIYTYDAFDRMLTMNGPMGSGQVMTYDNNGNVETEEVFNITGNQITLKAYDVANRLRQVTLPEGGIMTYSYDANGNIATEAKPNGYLALYSYNNLNLPTTKTINQQTWQLTYDLAGNLKTERWPKVGDQDNGNVITYEYDVLNREISRTDTVGLIQSQTHDADSNLKTQTDGRGETTTYEYNALHQRTLEIKPLGRGHSYTYTVFDELLTDTGPNGTITHGIDQLGRRYSSTGPDDYNMTYGYDLNGNLTSQTDSRDITTTYLVNALNQTYQQTTGSFVMTMSHDTVGNVLTQTDYRGILSENSYDKDNRQLTHTRAGVLQSTTTYNEAGLPVVVKDARGHNTVHEYNSQYHKTRTLLPENQIISFTPNAFGDVTFQNNPGPNDITRTYDLRRRLKTETNGAGNKTEYEYDLNNNRTAVIKPGGQRWEYDFDAANRLTAVRNVPEEIETIYGYDTADNLETITDALGRVNTFTFDNRNRKKTKTYPGANDVNGDVVAFDYDANGNLEQITYPNGVVVDYSYDDLNRQYQQDYSGTYGNASVTLTLDGNGNVEHIAETIDANSYTYAMSYDDLDRMESKTDRYGNVFLYTYDANGNRKQFRDHDNKVTTYDYDKLNRLKQLTQAGLGAFDWTYNTAGLPKTIDYPNGSQANYNYDNANRIELIDNKQSGVTVTSHAYEYDLNGNRDKLTESNIDASQITTYEYDDADRLTKVFYPTKVASYTLDKVGNRELEVVDSGGVLTTIDYGYNNRDQLTSVTDTDGLNITYDYDAFGNQTEKDTNGVITTFDYTARQRVKSITIGTNSPNEYQYDYAGQRINSQTNGMEKHYLYDGLTLVAETNAIGNTLATYHYGQRRQLAETRNTTNSYYLADALGTNVAITNQDGSIQNRMDYDVWGNLNQETGSSESPFGFTGYIRDEDTDLYYANARYYDSFTGRFLREDPLNGDVNTPPSLHRYNYAASNPTYYIDPDGRAFFGFQGTGQDDSDPAINPNGRLSNVNVLESIYQTEFKTTQVGLGTNEGNSLANLNGKLYGTGADWRIENAYVNLILAQNGLQETSVGLTQVAPDRQIDAAGFSRGAGMARIFANKVYDDGIPDLTGINDVELVRNGLKLSLMVNGQPINGQNLPKFKNPQINSLLLFDSVGAFGSSGNNVEEKSRNLLTGMWDPNDVYNLSIPPNVINVRHAISYNELRDYFPLTSVMDPFNPFDPRIVERVFYGVHTDIGCCYQNDDSLSRDALFWMWNEARSLNVPLDSLPPEYMPTHPSSQKPVKRYQKITHTIRGSFVSDVVEPQQGSRFIHDSRYNPFSESPRSVYYLRNPGSSGSRNPYYFDTVKGPEHFNFMQQIYGKQYLFNAEEAYKP